MWELGSNERKRKLESRVLPLPSIRGINKIEQKQGCQESGDSLWNGGGQGGKKVESTCKARGTQCVRNRHELKGSLKKRRFLGRVDFRAFENR